MMIRKVNGEAPFQVLASNFSIGPSNEGYTLQISADGNNYSDLFTVGPDTTRMVTGVANGSFYRLSGNESEVSVNWQTQCSDGQGGGGTGPQGPQGPQGYQGPAGGGGDSGQVQTQIDEAIDAFSEELQDGDPVVGLAKQLYSPDGVTSDGFFVYRTTAGDEDVTSGIAELRKLGGEGWVSVLGEAAIEASYTPQGQPDAETYVEITNEYLLAYSLGNVVTATSCQYVQGEWIPELPAGIEVVGDPYEAGMVNISIVTPITWTPNDGQPDEFVALGLNSYNKDADTEICTTVDGDRDNYEITIKAVKGLEDGYIVYSTTSAISSCLITDGEGGDDTATEIVGGALYVVYPTDEYPYISIVTDDKDSICVHPRWSGIKDEEYEAYSETRIDLSSLPRLYKVGEDEGQYDYIDFVNGNVVRWIDIQSYDVDVLLELESNEAIYDCDGTYIYTTKDEPVITPLNENIDYTYAANDFSVEYFAKDGAIGDNYTCYAETYYMNNLIDKLRRMKVEFVHLDNLDSNGEAGVTYEYQGKLMIWNPNAGNTAEWLRLINLTNANEGTDLIFTKIPDGQKLFEYKYQYGGDWRNVIYSGGTLYLTETAGTVVCAVTIGSTFEFQTTQYGNIYRVIGVFEKNRIGFKKTDYVSFQNVWNGVVNGGHYELLEKIHYPYLGTANDTFAGIPRWNGNGQVVKGELPLAEKDIYFNFTGSNFAYRLQALVSGQGSNLPARIWVPTDAGTQGQILISTGGNAPVWSSWIKSVKISSADYENLVTKDPNTLYLIVDE